MRIAQQPTGSYTLTCELYDETGAPLNPEGPYSATIHDGAGATVWTGVPIRSSQQLVATVPVVALARLDSYAVTWTGTSWSSSSTVELVGALLFTVAELRSFDRAFTDATKWPASSIAVARDWVQDTIEGELAADVAFVLRGRRVTLDGTGRHELVLPDYEASTIYSASIAGTALTSPELAALIVEDDRVWRSTPWPSGRQNVTLHYVHGRAQVPGPIRRAALMLAREYLSKTDMPGRATATSIGDQTFRLTIAGRDGVTGLPEVDAAIDQFGRKSFTVL